MFSCEPDAAFHVFVVSSSTDLVLADLISFHNPGTPAPLHTSATAGLFPGLSPGVDPGISNCDAAVALVSGIILILILVSCWIM